MNLIGVDIKPSKQFILLFTIIFFMSFILIYLIPVLFGIKLFLAFFLLFYLYPIFRRYVLLKNVNSIIRISREKKDWSISDRQKKYSAVLCGDSTVTGWVSVLRFKIPEKKLKQTCIVFRDSMDAEDYRKLIVALRF